MNEWWGCDWHFMNNQSHALKRWWWGEVRWGEVRRGEERIFVHVYHNQCCRSQRLGPTSRSVVLCRRDSKVVGVLGVFSQGRSKLDLIGPSRTKSDIVTKIVHSLLLSLTSEHCDSLLHWSSWIVVVARRQSSLSFISVLRRLQFLALFFILSTE